MMKKLFYFFLLVTLVNCSRENTNIGNFLNANIFNKKKKGTVVAKVDKVPLSLQEIREEMKFSLGYEFSEKDVENMISNSLIQKNYEEKIINQYLIIKECLKEKMFQTDDFKKYYLISLKEAIVKYYLYKKFFSIPDNNKWKEIMVTKDNEVNNFYEENKKYFDEKNIKKEDALSAIRSDFEKKKSNLFINELMKFQNNLIDELKVKYKVEKTNL